MCSLYIAMIPTVHEMDIKTFWISEYWIEPRIYLVTFYAVFVKNKLLVCLAEK